jgi:hypothetical protein
MKSLFSQWFRGGEDTELFPPSQDFCFIWSQFYFINFFLLRGKKLHDIYLRVYPDSCDAIKGKYVTCLMCEWKRQGEIRETF